MAAIIIVLLGVTAILFGSATAVMISREIADRKLRKQNEWFNEIELLREEYYTDIRRLEERITVISINQTILEGNLEKILKK